MQHVQHFNDTVVMRGGECSNTRVSIDINRLVLTLSTACDYLLAASRRGAAHRATFMKPPLIDFRIGPDTVACAITYGSYSRTSITLKSRKLRFLQQRWI